MSDRLDALEVFVAVAEEASFVKAARRLNRSAAGVTRAVAGLEDRLGVRLFNRTTRAVSLTDAGSRHLDRARRALAEFAEFESAAAGDRSDPVGLLTITAPEMFGRLHMLPVVQEFMRDYPAVEISLLLLNRIVSFVDEGVDLGIRIGELPDSSLRAILLGQVRRVLCASPDYLARHGMPETLQDLASHDAILTTGARPQIERWTFIAGGKTLNIPIRPRLTVNSVQAAVEAAIAGGGVVRLLSYQSARPEAEGSLVRLLDQEPQPPIPIHVVHPAGRYLPPKVRLFIDRTVEHLRGQFETCVSGTS